MATWYAKAGSTNINVASNWNSAADGSGSDMPSWPPATDDTLEANGKTALAINVDFTCAQIQTLNGGGFTLSLATAARTIVAGILAGTTPCLTTSGNTYAVSWAGDIKGGTSANAHGFVIGSTANGKINITGNVSGSDSVANAYGLYSGSGASNPTVIGNITGSTAHGVFLQTSSVDSITVVNGIITGGYTASSTVSGVYGIRMASGGYVILSGSSRLVFSATGNSPISDARIKWVSTDTGSNTITVYDGIGNPHVLKVPDYPAIANVKSGTVFDYGAQTGTYAGGGGGGRTPRMRVVGL